MTTKENLPWKEFTFEVGKTTTGGVRVQCKSKKETKDFLLELLKEEVAVITTKEGKFSVRIDKNGDLVIEEKAGA